MNKYLSNKITVLYTILIIMVVYIHSYYLEAEQYSIANFVQKTVGRFCSVANCMFFTLSGYLFARNIKSASELIYKLLKRVKTIAIPYICWNIIFVLWYIVLFKLFQFEKFNNSEVMLNNYFNSSIITCLYNLFIKPAAFQLWFLRDLIVMFAFTPLMWYITKKSYCIAIAIAICSVYFYPWLIYFWIGLIIGYKRIEIIEYKKTIIGVIASAFIYLGYAIFYTIIPINNSYITCFIYFVGLYFVWSTYDVLAKGRYMIEYGIWKYICGYSFFIYLFHEPIFNIIKKCALFILGASEINLILLYLINPWIMVTLAIIVAKVLKKVTPSLYKILTGGR